MEMTNHHPNKRAAEEEEEEISTELRLSNGHEARVINKKPRTLDPSTSSAAAIRNEFLYEEEEPPVGISLSLTLRHDDPWKITKRLTNSDVDKHCQFLLKTHSVKSHILRFWDAARIAEANSPSGTRVMIRDLDTSSLHELTFKRLSSSTSYVFKKNWAKEFVRRRILRSGDEIGLFWDCYYSICFFSVLTRT